MGQMFTVLVYQFSMGKGKTLIPDRCGVFADYEAAASYKDANHMVDGHSNILAEVVPMKVR